MTSYTDLFTYTGHCTHCTKTDLQDCELGGGIQKTFWQLCQLVAAKIPEEYNVTLEGHVWRHMNCASVSSY